MGENPSVISPATSGGSEHTLDAKLASSAL
jgi:hypothetical protein